MLRCTGVLAVSVDALVSVGTLTQGLWATDVIGIRGLSHTATRALNAGLMEWLKKWFNVMYGPRLATWLLEFVERSYQTLLCFKALL